MAPYVCAEIFEVVPSHHQDFENALACLHMSLHADPSCVKLAKTVRADAYTSLINVIVWHTWTSKTPYRAARKSEAYRAFIDYTRRFCASRRHVVSHPVISELAVNVPLGIPCSSISPSASGNADEYVTSQEAVYWADQNLYHRGIGSSGGSSASSGSSGSSEEEEEAVTPPSTVSTLESSTLWGSPSSSCATAIPIAGSTKSASPGLDEPMGSSHAVSAMSMGWLSELAEMESRWKKVRPGPAGSGSAGWERAEETWALDMLLA